MWHKITRFYVQKLDIDPNQVVNFIEYLKLSYIDTDAPENVTIKSKKDLKEKLQRGLDDIKSNKVYSLDDVFAKIENI